MIKSLSVATQSVLIAIIAYGSFSHADVLTKFLTRTYSVSTCLTITGIIGLTVSFFWILTAKGWQGFNPPNLKFHLIRACVVTLSSHLALNAIKLLPLPEFYSIVFMAPISVVILAALLGHEKFMPHRFLTVFLGFTGVLIIVGPQYQTLGFGIVYALLCVLCTSVSILVIRKIGQGHYPPVYCFYPFLVILLCSAPFAQLPSAMPPIRDIIMFAASAAIVIVGHITIPLAYSKAPQASLIAPVFYTQMLWGILYGMLFFNWLPTVETMLGASFIIFGGLYMIWKEKVKRRATVNQVVLERE